MSTFPVPVNRVFSETNLRSTDIPQQRSAPNSETATSNGPSNDCVTSGKVLSLSSHSSNSAQNQHDVTNVAASTTDAILLRTLTSLQETVNMLVAKQTPSPQENTLLSAVTTQGPAASPS